MSKLLRRVIVAQNAKRLLLGFRHIHQHQREAGGILLGYEREDAIFISRATIPTTFDRATRRTFVRSPEYAQAIVEYEFANSGGRLTYVGEWHSHPESHPTPSPRDTRMIEEQFAGNEIHVGQLVMLIIGTVDVHCSVFDGERHVQAACDLRVK
jgi:integrative and conjugative element protein (TIGR02256 family)